MRQQKCFQTTKGFHPACYIYGSYVCPCVPPNMMIWERYFLTMFAAYSWETTSYGKAVSQSICMFRAARPGFPFSQDHYLHPLPSHQLDCPSSRSPESSWLESQPMGYSQEMGEISAGSTEQLPIHSERRNERNSWSSWIIHDRGLLDYLSIISFDTCA